MFEELNYEELKRRANARLPDRDMWVEWHKCYSDQMCTT